MMYWPSLNLEICLKIRYHSQNYYLLLKGIRIFFDNKKRNKKSKTDGKFFKGFIIFEGFIDSLHFRFRNITFRFLNSNNLFLINY